MGLAGELLNEYAITKEAHLLDQAWTRLSTNGAVAYGRESLIRAMSEGAIETFLITAELLRDEGETIQGKTWAKWTEGLGDIGAELVQCSTDHDAWPAINWLRWGCGLCCDTQCEESRCELSWHGTWEILQVEQMAGARWLILTASEIPYFDNSADVH